MDFINSIWLMRVNQLLPEYFSYSLPWTCLLTSLFALLALFGSKKPTRSPRRDNSLQLLVYLYKWQYVVILIYSINMITNDSQFTLKLFGYTSKKISLNAICKICLVFERLIYCLAPWFQVVS